MACKRRFSLSIFKFEGADATDVYFSLRCPKGDMLGICRRVPVRQPFNVAQFQVSCACVDLLNFNRLMSPAEEFAGACADLQARNRELLRRNCELEEDGLRRQAAGAHEVRQAIASVNVLLCRSAVR
jgi:hypothetical protein